MSATHVPLGGNEAPVDLAAVQADDALLDMLRAGEFDDLLERADALYDPASVAYAEMRIVLARVLVAWRRDVDAGPVGELVGRYVALSVIEDVRRWRERRRRLIATVAAVLAILAIAVSWLGVVALDAQPGDLLWPVHELLYSKDGE